MSESPYTLPDNVPLAYLAEGAANIVYKPILTPSTPLSSTEHLSSRLLRLNKALPSRVPVSQSHRDFCQLIRPLFGANDVVDQQLILLPAHTIQTLNARLKEDERARRRPVKRLGLYLAKEEGYGLLVRDMTPDLARGEVVVEFKPKWLAQSPSAPEGARRCRTCALAEQRNAIRRSEGGKELPYFCPLDLVSCDERRVGRAVQGILSTSKARGAGSSDVYERLVAVLLESKVLLRLKELQETLDPLGIFDADEESRDFRIATTLRDCSVFVKMPADTAGEVELRLGDLDLKSGRQGKAGYWRAVEETLISEGWYMGTEGDPRPERVWCFGDQAVEKL